MRNATILAAAIVAASLQSRAATMQTGDQHRSYIFAGTQQSMPYRLFVPSSYDGSKAYPLVVVLHGSGNDENGPFKDNDLEHLAEQRGYILLAPLGFARFGGYGDIYPVVVTQATRQAGKAFRTAGAGPPPPPPRGAPAPSPALPDDYAEQPAGELVDVQTGALSEAETLAALADVQAHFRIDPARTYLMGNSMGAVGTMYLAAKYPKLWAAISPSGGPVAAWSYPFGQLHAAHVAVLFVHGELDEHANAKWSRALMEQARGQGVSADFIEVRGGHHRNAWMTVLPQIFDFFSAHAKS